MNHKSRTTRILCVHFQHQSRWWTDQIRWTSCLTALEQFQATKKSFLCSKYLSSFEANCSHAPAYLEKQFFLSSLSCHLTSFHHKKKQCSKSLCVSNFCPHISVSPLDFKKPPTPSNVARHPSFSANVSLILESLWEKLDAVYKTTVHCKLPRKMGCSEILTVCYAREAEN